MVPAWRQSRRARGTSDFVPPDTRSSFSSESSWSNVPSCFSCFVIHPALKDGALWRTTWNTKLHHFPASTGALGQRSLHRQSRAIHTAFQNFGSVEVGMVDVAAARAAETLPVARTSVDQSAARTGLRAVGRSDFNQTTAA